MTISLNNNHSQNVNTCQQFLAGAVGAFIMDRATPGETSRAGIRQGTGRISVTGGPAGTSQNSTPLPDILNAERRQLLGIRFPSGHRFFPDRERESYARLIDWAIHLPGMHSLFITLTFQYQVSMTKANRLLNIYLARIEESLRHKGGNRLIYFVATEWQKRDVVHFHLVLIGKGLELLSRKRLEARWEHLSGTNPLRIAHRTNYGKRRMKCPTRG